MGHIFISLLVFAFAESAVALSPAEQDRLEKAVDKLCLFPDRAGEHVRVEGEAKLGVPVLMRFLNAGVSAKISHETWKGFNPTLDKYKTDPRQCSMRITELLLPTFLAQPVPEAPKMPSSPQIPFARITLHKSLQDGSYFSEPFPTMMSLIVSNTNTGTSVAFVKFKEGNWSPSEALLPIQPSDTKFSIETRATYQGSTTRSTCPAEVAASHSSTYEVRGYLTDDALAQSSLSGGLIYTAPTQSQSSFFPFALRIPKLVDCQLAKVL